jgi:hypothetical protein
MLVPNNFVTVNQAVVRIAKPEAIMAVVAFVLKENIAISKSSFNGIMRGMGTFIVAEYIVVGYAGMLILAKENPVARIRKVVVLNQVLVADQY